MFEKQLRNVGSLRTVTDQSLPPYDILLILKYFGYNAYDTDFEEGEHVIGSIDTYDCEPKFYVKRSLDSYKKRFILAHLLGHLTLLPEEAEIRETQESIVDNSNVSNVFANTFARQLLFPLKAVREAIICGANTVGTLSELFELPESVITAGLESYKFV